MASVQCFFVVMCLLSVFLCTKSTNKTVTLSREDNSVNMLHRIVRFRHPHTSCPTVEEVYSCNVTGDSIHLKLIHPNETILVTQTFVKGDAFTPHHEGSFKFSDLLSDETSISVKVSIPPLLELNNLTINCSSGDFDVKTHVFEEHREIEPPCCLEYEITERSKGFVICWNVSRINDFGFYKLEILRENLTLLIQKEQSLNYYDRFHTSEIISLHPNFTGEIHLRLYILNWCNISSNAKTLMITQFENCSVSNYIVSKYTVVIVILIVMLYQGLIDS